MLSQRPIVAFIPTTNATRARAFYVDVIGLAFVAEDAMAMMLDANGIMIRVTKVERFTPQPFAILGWEVHSVVNIGEMLRGKGVKFERFNGLVQDENAIWTSPSGAKVAWFKDPDGNILSISQP